MAVMATALTVYGTSLNERKWTFAGHSAEKPRLLLQKRKEGSNVIVLEDTITTLVTTVDSEGNILPQKVMLQTTLRRPLAGQTGDVNTALGVHVDAIATDNYALGVVPSQIFLDEYVPTP